MAVDLRLPNITADTPEIKIEQLKSYMYQLVQELNFALNSVSSEASISNDRGIMSDYMDAVTIFSNIKYLIMKSNDIINAYYDAIKKKLEDVYVDVSDYQLFVNSINNSITELNNSNTELNNSINNLNSDLRQLSDGKADNPSTGKVGQIIAILTVDENGKPTSYQAIDKPSGAEISTEELKEAVNNYLAENPIEEIDPTVPEWAKSPQKPTYTASEIGADDAGTAESKVSVHNTATYSHNDIRELISGLTQRLNALADSDDTTLDQMSEVVAYIKSNKSLIDAITTSKINVSDIIDNLTTNVSNKPLSASQGVVLKALIDAITTVELDETLTDNTKAAPAGIVGDIKSDISVLQALGLRVVDGMICQAYKEE